MRLFQFTTVCIVTVLVSLLIGPAVQNAQGQGVSVAPLRVLFDGKVRSATVFLSNRTPETGVYRINLVNRRMLETGKVVPAEEELPGEFFADDLIRFSPRRVTIAPFSSQTIRLLVRRPRRDLPENVELRTHLSIRSIPQAPRLTDLENVDRVMAEGTISVHAVATIETVIPIIVRIGDPKATIEIENPVLDFTGGDLSDFPKLSVDLVRTGERSVYGELEINHVAQNGDITKLHMARGLAVYFPTQKRTRNIYLDRTPPELLESGQIHVRFTESEKMHGDQSAELFINLSQESANIQ